MSKQILINKETHRQLIAVSKWYDQMPRDGYLVAGDSFHENVFEFQHSCIPEGFVPEGFVPEDWYVCYFEFRQDDMYAICMDELETQEPVAYRLAASEEI